MGDLQVRSHNDLVFMSRAMRCIKTSQMTLCQNQDDWLKTSKQHVIWVALDPKHLILRLPLHYFGQNLIKAGVNKIRGLKRIKLWCNGTFSETKRSTFSVYLFAVKSAELCKSPLNFAPLVRYTCFQCLTVQWNQFEAFNINTLLLRKILTSDYLWT